MNNIICWREALISDDIALHYIARKKLLWRNPLCISLFPIENFSPKRAHRVRERAPAEINGVEAEGVWPGWCSVTDITTCLFIQTASWLTFSHLLSDVKDKNSLFINRCWNTFRMYTFTCSTTRMWANEQRPKSWRVV